MDLQRANSLELERHFRETVYNSIEGLTELREILSKRNSSLSQRLLVEVQKRLRNLALGLFQGASEPFDRKTPGLELATAQLQTTKTHTTTTTPRSQLLEAPPSKAKVPPDSQWLFGRPLLLARAVEETVGRMARLGRAIAPSEVDLDLVLQRLRSRQWENDRQRSRDRRWLPFLLFHGNPPAASQLGLETFWSELEKSQGTSILQDVIDQYFRHFHAILTPQVGQWILDRLLKIDLAKCRRSWVHHYKQHESLFGGLALDYAVRQLPPTKTNCDDWVHLELPRDCWLYENSLAQACYQAITEGNSGALETLYSYIQRTTTVEAETAARNHSKEIESKTVFRRVVEQSLLAYAKRDSLVPDTELVAMALENLGDPRVPTSLDWFSLDPRAVEMIKLWLSIEDLEIFFGRLADASDEKARSQYWKPFVMRRKVSQSKIFLGQNVIARKREHVERHIASGRYGRLLGQSCDDTCAIILKIGRAVVVEFSKTNNACYIFPEEQFDKSYWNARSAQISELKSRVRGKQMNHTGSWQQNFSRYLLTTYQII